MNYAEDTPPVPAADPELTKNPRVESDPKPTISLTEARSAVRKLFGPTGRIWVLADGTYAMGVDKRPGRQIVLTGADLWLLLFGRYTPPPPDAAGKATPPVPAAPEGVLDAVATNPENRTPGELSPEFEPK